MRRFFAAMLVVLLLIGVVLVAAVRLAGAGQSTSAPGGRQPSLFVAPSGSDSGSCTQPSPCASWNAAYQRARPGQVIDVAGGTYPRQVLASRGATRDLAPGCAPEQTANCIVFRPHSGATVTLQEGLEIYGSSVWVQGASSPPSATPARGRAYSIVVKGRVETRAASDTDFPDHVVLQGISAVTFGVLGTHDAVLRDMDIGPATVGANCEILEGPGDENKVGEAGDFSVVPRDVTLDGLVIHNQNRNTDGEASGCHFGGLFIISANGLTIERTLFSQDAVYDIQVQNFGGEPVPTHVTIQNNWFGCPTDWLYDQPAGDRQCDGQADLQFNAASPFSHWLIRYNSFVGGIGEYVDGATFDDIRVVGNAGGHMHGCLDGVTSAANVWNGAKCGPTDRSTSSRIVQSNTPGSEDFRLAPGSPAAAAVPATTPDLELGSDIAGQARPARFPGDAGALARDTATLVLGRSIGSVAIGDTAASVEQAYGRPRRVIGARLGVKRISGATSTYVVPGGRLRVTTVQGRVVAVSTDSAFYSTRAGVGVGGNVAETARLHGARWTPCARSVRLRVGPAIVSFGSAASQLRVTSISMVQRSLLVDCGVKH